MLNLFKNLRNDESGAVTVDWVVLTAAIVGLGVAAITAVSGGINSLGAEVAGALDGTGEGATSYLGAGVVEPTAGGTETGTE